MAVENKEMQEAPKDADKETLDLITGAKPEEVNKAVDKIVPNPEETNKKLANYTLTPETLSIEKKQTGFDEKISLKALPGEKQNYTIPLLDIRNLKSGDSKIPAENASSIINAIDTLGAFQTMDIIGCTDASKIDTPTAIEKNKNQFDTNRAKYLAAGGTCPSYEDLSKSPKDPQNTILGYARAMEGVLSLNLSPDQMKKVTIGNRLGTKEDFGQERGFDIKTNYTKQIDDLIRGATYEELYKMMGELTLENIGYGYNNSKFKDEYTISTNYMSTMRDKLTGVETQLLTTVLPKGTEIVGKNPEDEAKMKKQISDYLNHLITTSMGGHYDKGVWDNKEFTHKEYYTMAAVHDKLITKDEFTRLMEDKDISILENKSLEYKDASGKPYALKDLIREKGVTRVYNKGTTNPYTKESGRKVYEVEEKQGTPRLSENQKTISQKDYVLIGLYLEMKKDSAKN